MASAAKSKKIEVLENGLRVHDLEILRKDVADFFRAIPEKDREAALAQAIEVGVFCLERARTSQDTDFVRRQVESLLAEVEKAVGAVPESVQKEMMDKIGTGEGQVLAPIQTLINAVAKSTTDRLREVQELLSKDIDPAKSTSVLGKALNSIQELLDPKRKDSVQGRFEEALTGVTAEEGMLAKSVKKAVAEAVKPLAQEVDELSKEIRGQEAAEETLSQTTAKGFTYEQEVLESLQEWKKHTGAEVEHVGPDNKSGDILIRLPQNSIAAVPAVIVIEVKDKKSPDGKKPITHALVNAMEERNANASIYLSKYREGLAKEIGEWDEGKLERGPYVATTHEYLRIAVRGLILMHQIDALRTFRPEIDASAIVDQVRRIHTTLKRVGTISKKASDIRSGADAITDEGRLLREEVRQALSEIEDAIRTIADSGEEEDPEAADVA